MWQQRISVIAMAILVAILLAVGVPGILQSREAVRRTQSMNNLKQIGLAVHNYADAFFGRLPAGGSFDRDRRGYCGWMVQILPYIDDSPFYIRVNQNEPWNSTYNAGLFLTSMRCYENPSEPIEQRRWHFPVAHYCANANLIAANSSVQLNAIPDHSQVFFVGELDGGFVPWACPYNWRELNGINLGPPTYGRSTRDGCQFLMADGSVKFVGNDASNVILQAMNGADLTRLHANELDIHIPSMFPCPGDALWVHWSYEGDDRVEIKEDIHGNVKSTVRIQPSPNSK